MEDKLGKLKRILTDMESVLIAYSGGVDSTFLASVAYEVLGSRAVAVSAASPTYPEAEIEEAKALAKQIGFRHILIDTHELDDPAFVANDVNRCYYCKGELFGRLRRIADDEGLKWVADGFNYEDLQDFRPGHRAGQEIGVRSPLCEAGLTKADIRQLSKVRGLPTWDKPSLACLSSRLPYGTAITLDILNRIGQAEQYLHGLGVRQLRVRHHDTIARIEVEPQDMALLLSQENREDLVRRFKELGYIYVTLDMAGYRTGSMNEVLSGVDARA
jgi:uncharacterized protein